MRLRVLVGPNGRTPEVNYVRHWNDDDAMTPWGLIRADETDDDVAAALAGHAFLPTKAERDAGLPGPRGRGKC